MGNNRSVLFLTLNTFSGTGGIEKVCRIAGKAIHEICSERGDEFSMFSLHDQSADAINNKYFPHKYFTGFRSSLTKFFLSTLIKKRKKNNMVILSHINLLPVGYLIKAISPKTKLILFAHGIEIWNILPSFKMKMLNSCNEIWAVSNFTKNKISEVNKFPIEKIKILNNSLDPFLYPHPGKSEVLYKKLGLNKEDKIMLTVTRFASDEQYKGYDQVFRAMAKLMEQCPNLQYLLVGKYDEKEKLRINKMVSELNLNQKVFFTGFVPDIELAEHFAIADLFIMPSTMEGFGIVFIEAAFYGLPVIAGNKDGTCDALLNGKLGLLIDPGNIDAISSAIQKILDDPEAYRPDHTLLMNNFGYNIYKRNLNDLLNNLTQMN